MKDMKDIYENIREYIVKYIMDTTLITNCKIDYLF